MHRNFQKEPFAPLQGIVNDFMTRNNVSAATGADAKKTVEVTRETMFDAMSNIGANPERTAELRKSAQTMMRKGKLDDCINLVMDVVAPQSRKVPEIAALKKQMSEMTAPLMRLQENQRQMDAELERVAKEAKEKGQDVDAAVLATQKRLTEEREKTIAAVMEESKAAMEKMKQETMEKMQQQQADSKKDKDGKDGEGASAEEEEDEGEDEDEDEDESEGNEKGKEMGKEIEKDAKISTAQPTTVVSTPNTDTKTAPSNTVVSTPNATIATPPPTGPIVVARPIVKSVPVPVTVTPVPVPVTGTPVPVVPSSDNAPHGHVIIPDNK